MTTREAHIRSQNSIHAAAQVFVLALPAEHRTLIDMMAEDADPPCEPWQIAARAMEELIARYKEGLGSTTVKEAP